MGSWERDLLMLLSDGVQISVMMLLHRRCGRIIAQSVFSVGFRSQVYNKHFVLNTFYLFAALEGGGGHNRHSLE
jgi:hypothetical protein